jgi:hypothetical protein
VKNWKKWDPEVEWATLEGPFELEGKGKLKPLGGPVTRFVLTEVTPQKSFSVRSSLFFAHMNFVHSIMPEENQWRVTHRIEMGGALEFLFVKLLGAKLEKGLPRAVKEMVRQAEEDV